MRGKSFWSLLLIPLAIIALGRLASSPVENDKSIKSKEKSDLGASNPITQRLTKALPTTPRKLPNQTPRERSLKPERAKPAQGVGNDSIGDPGGLAQMDDDIPPPRTSEGLSDRLGNPGFSDRPPDPGFERFGEKGLEGRAEGSEPGVQLARAKSLLSAETSETSNPLPKPSPSPTASSSGPATLGGLVRSTGNTSTVKIGPQGLIKEIGPKAVDKQDNDTKSDSANNDKQEPRKDSQNPDAQRSSEKLDPADVEMVTQHVDFLERNWRDFHQENHPSGETFEEFLVASRPTSAQDGILRSPHEEELSGGGLQFNVPEPQLRYVYSALPEEIRKQVGYDSLKETYSKLSRPVVSRNRDGSDNHLGELSQSAKLWKAEIEGTPRLREALATQKDPKKRLDAAKGVLAKQYARDRSVEIRTIQTDEVPYVLLSRAGQTLVIDPNFSVRVRGEPEASNPEIFVGTKGEFQKAVRESANGTAEKALPRLAD